MHISQYYQRIFRIFDLARDGDSLLISQRISKLWIGVDPVGLKSFRLLHNLRLFLWLAEDRHPRLPSQYSRRRLFMQSHHTRRTGYMKFPTVKAGLACIVKGMIAI